MRKSRRSATRSATQVRSPLFSLYTSLYLTTSLSALRTMSTGSSRANARPSARFPSGSSEDGAQRRNPPSSRRYSNPPLPRSNFEDLTGARTQWRIDDEAEAPAYRFTDEDNLGRLSPAHTKDDSRRSSDASGDTLFDEELDYRNATPRQPQTARSALGAYTHPYEIQTPPEAHARRFSSPQKPYSPSPRRGVDNGDTSSSDYDYDLEKAGPEMDEPSNSRQGYLSNLIDMYTADEDQAVRQRVPRGSIPSLSRFAHSDDRPLDPDDPLLTGIRKRHLDDVDDVERNARRQIPYHERMQEKLRVRIEYNVCCTFPPSHISRTALTSYCIAIETRQNFLMTFARALLMFGAPSHRNETQLVSAARILEVDAEFTHFPGLIIASFGDEETKSSQLHFAKSGGRLSLGNLHKLHEIYRAVVHDELSAKQAIVRLEDIIAGRPMFRTPVRLTMSFVLAMLICPIAFGGSFVDMFVAGLGSLMLASVQIFVASRKSVIYANVYE